MAIKEFDPNQKPVIRLDSPEGNAFALIGAASDFGRLIGLSSEKIKEIQDDMMSKDYEHLIQVFDGHYGHLVDLVRPIPQKQPILSRRPKKC